MLKKTLGLLASAAMILGVSQVASAADLAVKAPPMAAPVAVYNWTGFYIGAVAGVGRTKYNRDGFYDTNPVNDTFTDPSVGVGGTVGFNWQFNNFVLGIEGDGSWQEQRRNVTCAAGLFVAGGDCFDSSSLARFSSNWYATIRGRLGWLADPRVLLYVTGGAAFGDVSYQVHDFAITGEGEASTTHTGWAAGAGVEWMIAQNWTLKGEYLHVDLGSKTFAPVVGVFAPDFVASIKPQFDLVRVGVNYKFGWGGGPVVARY